jgi:hypothetical protein
MDEMRKTPRFKIKQLIGFQAIKEEYLWAEGLDISSAGISCIADEAIEPDTNVFFMISVYGAGGEGSVRGEGYVLHSEQEGGRCRFGIKIDRIFDEDKPRFDAFLEELSGKGSGV